MHRSDWDYDRLLIPTLCQDFVNSHLQFMLRLLYMHNQSPGFLGLTQSATVQAAETPRGHRRFAHAIALCLNRPSEQG
jgi:hypothetical protein